ncbi:MAG: hypothetical protein DMF64_16105 [Acidobacteria bacterium]|nr:MAG: hypothetical protein DMF64_16105 [Acidobacteriota bacterium]
MERYFFRITIALITFFLGTGATLLWVTLRAPDVNDFEQPPAPVIYGGLLNDRAIPPLHINGYQSCPEWNVHITIDETGRVISASSDFIDPLARYDAEKVALAYRFKPMLLAGQPVKVAGVIDESPEWPCLSY